MPLCETLLRDICGRRLPHYLPHLSPIIAFMRGVGAELKGRPRPEPSKAQGREWPGFSRAAPVWMVVKTRLSPALVSAGHTNFWQVEWKAKVPWGESAGLGLLPSPDQGVSASGFDKVLTMSGCGRFTPEDSE